MAPEETFRKARRLTVEDKNGPPSEFAFENEGNVNAEMVLQQSAVRFSDMSERATAALVALLEAEDTDLLSPESRKHFHRSIDRIYQQVAQLQSLSSELLALVVDLNLLGVKLSAEDVKEKLQQLKEQERVSDTRHLNFYSPSGNRDDTSS